MTKVERFHYQRRMFAFPYGLIKLSEGKDIRSHEEWLKDEMYFTGQCLRGYVDKTGIYFYSTRHYKTRQGDWKKFQNYLCIMIVSMGLDLSGNLLVHEGVIPGKLGEHWEPRKTHGKLKDILPLVELL